MWPLVTPWVDSVRILGSPGETVGQCWAMWGLSWGHFGRSWGLVGKPWGALGPILGNDHEA